MADNARFRALAVRERALVAIGVLLDGHDAAEYFLIDRDRGSALSRSAGDLAQLGTEIRMPLVGTLLRAALLELEQER